jgi:hypothetical protein
VLLRRGPVAEPGEGACLRVTVIESGRKAPEMERPLYRNSVRGTWDVKEGSGDGHLFLWGLVGKPGRGLICWGLIRGKRIWDGCLFL